ncbi:MAG TPA: tetratricopeptide repeat protein [Steroidobacteraceae bacterium]|nr:tetratricopeptide repeat protein [Steroidobacteraceae bacterium]
MNTARLLPLLMLLGSLAQAQSTARQPDAVAKTVVGPANADLAEGAAALRAGDAEQGVRLTERGLAAAGGRRERVAGYSNLCAGLAMLERLEEALQACDRALQIDDRHWRSYSNRALVYLKQHRYAEAERDIANVEALSPQAHTLEKLRSMYRDAVDPVSPSIIIDDSREASGDAANR